LDFYWGTCYKIEELYTTHGSESQGEAQTVANAKSTPTPKLTPSSTTMIYATRTTMAIYWQQWMHLRCVKAYQIQPRAYTLSQPKQNLIT